MDANTVAFMVTDRCSASCGVCCFQCSPEGSYVMDAETIKAYMREAAEMGTVKIFAFTGGEAMLYPELLLDVMSYGKKVLGIGSTLVSNGFWAADYSRGKKIAAEFKEAGLIDMKLSADRFHQQYVPAKSVRNAIRILSESGIGVSVSVMDTGGHDVIRQTLEQLRPEIYGATVNYYPLFMTEQVRSSSRVDVGEIEIASPLKWDNILCPDAGSVQLFFDGYMYTCCSQFTFDVPRLRIGKVGETTLAEAQKRANRDPVLDMVRRRGPSWFAARAKERGIPVKERYSCQCELCHDMLRNESFIKEIEPEAEAESQRLRVEKFMSIMME